MKDPEQNPNRKVQTPKLDKTFAPNPEHQTQHLPASTVQGLSGLREEELVLTFGLSVSESCPFASSENH